VLDHRARSVLRTSQYSAVAEVRFRPCGPGVELAEAVEAVAFGRQTKRVVKSGGRHSGKGRRRIGVSFMPLYHYSS